MKLNLVLLVVGVCFVTVTRQETDHGAIPRQVEDRGLISHDLSLKKKCDPKVVEHYTKLKHSLGLTPIQQSLLKLCETPIIVIITTTTTTTSTTTTTTSTTTAICRSRPPSLASLHHLYLASRTDNFYTPSTETANAFVNAFGYVEQSSPGRVAASEDCPCPGLTLVPVYFLATPRNAFYTTSATEVNDFTTTKGYMQLGIGWFCSPEKGLCGASVPLYRYKKSATEYIYITDRSEAQGTFDGITCYIWRGPRDIANPTEPEITT